MERYEVYKDSRVDWLDEIPVGWGIVSLKWKSHIYAGGTPDKDRSEYWLDGTIPWLNSGAVNQFVITEPSDFITEEGFRNSSAKWIEKESIVVALAGQGKTKGMAAIATFRTTCNQSLSAIQPASDIDSRYLLYYLRANYLNIRGLAGEGKRDGLNLEMIGGIPISVPPLDEQTAIANFLDRKITEIDALIAQKERLLELYEEEKTANINHAVTKGLDPNVELKDSGVEWIGAIPQKWRVSTIGRIGQLGRGRVISNIEINENPGNYPVYSSQTKDGGVMGYLGSYDFQGEYVLWTTDGANAGTVTRRVGQFNCTNVCGTLQPNNWDEIDLRFLPYFLNLGTRFSVRLDINPKLMNGMMAKVPLVLPPKDEQTAIVQHIEAETSRINAKIAKTQRIIELQKEYRTALISEAVTGKIKVPELPTQEASA